MKKILLSIFFVSLYTFSTVGYSNPEQVMRDYFKAVKSHDVNNILKLFSENAKIITARSEIHGLAQIRQFYLAGVLSCKQFFPRYDHYLIAGNEIAVEIILHCDNSNKKVGDFFTIERDKITSLRVYSGKGYHPSSDLTAAEVLGASLTLGDT